MDQSWLASRRFRWKHPGSGAPSSVGLWLILHWPPAAENEPLRAHWILIWPRSLVRFHFLALKRAAAAELAAAVCSLVPRQPNVAPATHGSRNDQATAVNLLSASGFAQSRRLRMA